MVAGDHAACNDTRGHGVFKCASMHAGNHLISAVGVVGTWEGAAGGYV